LIVTRRELASSLRELAIKRVSLSRKKKGLVTRRRRLLEAVKIEGLAAARALPSSKGQALRACMLVVALAKHVSLGRVTIKGSALACLL